VTKIDVSPSADKVSSDIGARTAAVTLSDVTGPTTLTYTNGAVGCGRYTGGGSIFTSGGVRVTHGFELHCSIADVPNNLEINFDGDSFHLESLTSVHCTFPSGIPTITGTGTGRYNGVSGATITFLFTDEGEPGTSDDASYLIVAGGSTILSASADLTFGNQQFHAQKCKVK